MLLITALDKSCKFISPCNRWWIPSSLEEMKFHKLSISLQFSPDSSIYFPSRKFLRHGIMFYCEWYSIIRTDIKPNKKIFINECSIRHSIDRRRRIGGGGSRKWLVSIISLSIKCRAAQNTGEFEAEDKKKYERDCHCSLWD